MKRVPLLISLTVALLLHTGCSNGPLARMMRGGECSNCSTMPAETYPGAYETSGCATCGQQGIPTIGGAPNVNAPFTGQPGYIGTLPGPN
ncbi:MAG: hypothetical protein JNK57_21410 [Planctomycetaceae bacterium]|jgi:hypothetical protein|nr:hypothetical protein [Planctomycetaceae bacterium]